MSRFIFALALAVLLPTAGFAHTGVGAVLSFSDGLLHPLGGLDHLLAMFAVGLLAAQLGGRALWLVPTAFVSMMVVGALAGVAGLPLPAVEFAVGLSIVAIALPVALALGMPVALAMALVGAFAIFHGNAHGTEIPQGAAFAGYVAGFAVATAFIHAAGVLAGLGFVRVAERGSLLRLSGALIAVVGVLITVS